MTLPSVDLIDLYRRTRRYDFVARLSYLIGPRRQMSCKPGVAALCVRPIDAWERRAASPRGGFSFREEQP